MPERRTSPRRARRTIGAAVVCTLLACGPAPADGPPKVEATYVPDDVGSGATAATFSSGQATILESRFTSGGLAYAIVPVDLGTLQKGVEITLPDLANTSWLTAGRAGGNLFDVRTTTTNNTPGTFVDVYKPGVATPQTTPLNITSFPAADVFDAPGGSAQIVARGTNSLGHTAFATATVGTDGSVTPGSTCPDTNTSGLFFTTTAGPGPAPTFFGVQFSTHAITGVTIGGDCSVAAGPVMYPMTGDGSSNSPTGAVAAPGGGFYLAGLTGDSFAGAQPFVRKVTAALQPDPAFTPFSGAAGGGVFRALVANFPSSSGSPGDLGAPFASGATTNPLISLFRFRGDTGASDPWNGALNPANLSTGALIVATHMFAGRLYAVANRDADPPTNARTNVLRILPSTVSVILKPHLMVTKHAFAFDTRTDAPIDQARVGDLVEYVVTVANDGTAGSSSYTLIDRPRLSTPQAVLPAGFELLPPANCDAGTDAFVCHESGLDVGEKRTYRYWVRPEEEGKLRNIALATADGKMTSDHVAITIRRRAALELLAPAVHVQPNGTGTVPAECVGTGTPVMHSALIARQPGAGCEVEAQLLRPPNGPAVGQSGETFVPLHKKRKLVLKLKPGFVKTVPATGKVVAVKIVVVIHPPKTRKVVKVKLKTGLVVFRIKKG